MRELLLGVDGGGTNTRAILATTDGMVLGRGTASASNPRAVGFAASTAAIQAAMQAAILDAFAQPALPDDSVLAAACFGIAGVGRPPHKEQLQAWAESIRVAERTLVTGDVEPILAAGTPDGWGVALICGTGSSCYAQTPEGESLQVGGWGYLLGDEGSGYDIALRALRLATQSADGRGTASALLDAILAEWQLTDPMQLVAHVYEGGVARPELAALARPILALADAGDPDATRLLDDAAKELSRMAITAARRLSLVNPPLALAGGLFEASAYLRAALVARLHAQPDVNWGSTTVVTDPAQGALNLARRLLAE